MRFFPSHNSPTVEHRSIAIESNGKLLGAELWTPQTMRGVIVLAEGTGNQRFNRQNQHISNALNRQGFATVLVDLLTPRENADDEHTMQLRFNTPLLAGRVIDTIRTLRFGEQAWLNGLPIGLLGIHSGAGAALVSAARMPDTIRATVSLSGRPDLAGVELAVVQSPTLMVVGGDDQQICALNHDAATHMRCLVNVTVIDGASYTFEQDRALETFEELAGGWFTYYLANPQFSGTGQWNSEWIYDA